MIVEVELLVTVDPHAALLQNRRRSHKTLTSAFGP